MLGSEDLRRLEKLSWDQRGLVDYEVMLRAGMIAGTAESSFAWNLAIRRNHAGGMSNGRISTRSYSATQKLERACS